MKGRKDGTQEQDNLEATKHFKTSSIHKQYVLMKAETKNLIQKTRIEGSKNCYDPCCLTDICTGRQIFAFIPSRCHFQLVHDCQYCSRASMNAKTSGRIWKKNRNSEVISISAKQEKGVQPIIPQPKESFRRLEFLTKNRSMIRPT